MEVHTYLLANKGVVVIMQRKTRSTNVIIITILTHTGDSISSVSSRAFAGIAPINKHADCHLNANTTLSIGF